MRNYYLAIAVIWIVSITLVITGFFVAGTPVSQKDVQLDRTRMQDFMSIQNEITIYYQDNGILPSSLTSLTTSSNSYGINIKDPETGKDYDYVQINSTSYKLCTIFALDSKDIHDPTYSYPGQQTSHKKGYDCITYTTPIIPPSYPSLSPTPPQQFDAALGSGYTGTYTRVDKKFNDFYLKQNNPQEIHFHLTDSTVCFDNNEAIIDCSMLTIGDQIRVKANTNIGEIFQANAIMDFSK